MRVYRLRRARVLLEIAVTLFFASGAAAAAIVWYKIFGWLVAIMLLGRAVWLAYVFLKTGPVIAYDDKGIRLGAIGGARQIGWRQVRKIYIKRVETESRRGYGVSMDESWKRYRSVDIVHHKVSYGQGLFALRIGSTRDTLMLEYGEPGAPARTVRMDAPTMELPEDGIIALASDMIGVQERVLGSRDLAYARLGVEQAQSGAAPVAGVQADRFRRLGLGTGEDSTESACDAGVAPPAPMPLRQGFGRRGLQN